MSRISVFPHTNYAVSGVLALTARTSEVTKAA